MADQGDRTPVARQEAVQPSLWDRLVDELPGMDAEHDALLRDLTKALGSLADVEALVSGGTRAIEARDDLDEETRQLAHRLVLLSQRKQRLEEGGVVVTSDVLREAVRRDIEMLFNNERLEARFLLTEPPVEAAAKPGYALLAAGGISLLPRWARSMLEVDTRVALPIASAAGRFATAAVRWGIAGVDRKSPADTAAATL